MVEIILFTVAWSFCTAGLSSSFITGVPSAVFSFIGILIVYFCPGCDMPLWLLLLSLFAGVLITVLDYIAPAWFAKFTGGSKAGMWGATIGMILGIIACFVGFVFAPFICPFLGALVGELCSGTDIGKACKVGFFSSLAFLLTTGAKILYAILASVYIIIKGVILIFGTDLFALLPFAK